MSSIIKVNNIQDIGSNDIITSDGAGNVTLNASLSGFTSTGIDDNATSTAVTIDSSGNVGIGASNNTSYDTNAQNFLLASSGNTGMTIRSAGATPFAMIHFADGTTDNDEKRAGRIIYQHSIDTLSLHTANSERMRIDSSGNVGIGTSSPSSMNAGANRLVVGNGSTGQGLTIYSSTTTAGSIHFADGTSGDTAYRGQLVYNHNGDYMAMYTAASEAMRIDNQGSILVNNTATPHGQNSVGCFKVYGTGSGAGVQGLLSVARYQGDPLLVNRVNNDGAVITIYGQGTPEGSINVSGTTVSYNGFTGTHWSRLSDNSKPTILKGTILESLDEMMDWYQVQFDIIDEEGNTINQKESYALGDGESVGDVITYNFEGTDYQATIIQEGDVKHTKAKISNTVDAKNVYGVFMDWDNDDDTVNDMYVAQTGTFVVRINSAETVSKGDLIQSNGDGTGKVQADDIIRSSTVAKVLSTTKIETYDDGSYIVPCSLHC